MRYWDQFRSDLNVLYTMVTSATLDTSTEPVIMNKSFNEDGIKAVMAIRFRFVDQEGTKQLQLGYCLSLMNNSHHDASRCTLSTHIGNFEAAKIGYERCADELMSDVVYKSLLLNSINHYA